MLFDREYLLHISFERMQQPRLPIVPLRERYNFEYEGRALVDRSATFQSDHDQLNTIFRSRRNKLPLLHNAEQGLVLSVCGTTTQRKSKP